MTLGTQPLSVSFLPCSGNEAVYEYHRVSPTQAHLAEDSASSWCQSLPLPAIPQVIMEAWVKGVNPKGNSTNPSNWDFGSSFFFAGTVVTTIGKGSGEEGLPCLGWGSPKADAETGMWFL